jgi:hypothetical protein
LDVSVQTDEPILAIRSSLTVKNIRTVELEEESFTLPFGNDMCKCAIMGGTDEAFPDIDLRDDSIEFRINGTHRITVNSTHTQPDQLK